MHEGRVKTLNTALKHLAQLSAIDLKRAVDTKRHHPLWNEEVHIEEELINLDESFAAYRAAEDTLQEYPKMRGHILREQRTILLHCVGLIARMTKGENLPREYNDVDTTYAFTRLTRLIISEMLRVGRPMDKEMLEALKPFLSLRQRLSLREWGSFSPRLHLRLAFHRFAAMYGLIRQS